jgi:acetyl-CoA synthetase
MDNIENLAYSCLGRQIKKGCGDIAAFKWIHADLSQEEISYNQIEASSNKIAAILKDQGVKKHDKVSLFLPKSPDLIYSFFGILKNEAISCVLFSTFGESALYDRLNDNGSVLIITKKSLLKRILNIKDNLANLKSILVVDIDDHLNDFTLSLPKLLSDSPEDFQYPSHTNPEMPAFIQYTSGSTGKPKGAVHVHGAITAAENSFNEVFQIKEDETYWCTADPAWITGLVYGIIAPMATLTRQIQFGGNFNTENWLACLQNEKVNVWYTAPTALRMLMQEDENKFSNYDYSTLDRIYSVGEPLNPEVYKWAKKIFNCEVYDNFFQSETGTIMISNRPGIPVRPGSMGKPLSYIDAAVLDDEMKPVNVGSQGNLCLKKGWPSMFHAYLNKRELYEEKFFKDYYITGDLAFKDKDGYFWYVSRADDVINTAGHLVGPFEVESSLLEIEEISDVAVIGAPDKLLHEKIVAYLCLKNNIEWSRTLELKCRIKISNDISTTAIPQEYKIVTKIPKNRSGKILRRVLKAWYEGKDPGDLSTMEEQ